MKSLISTILNKIKAFFLYIWTNKKRPKVFIPSIVVLVVLIMLFIPNSSDAEYELYTVEQKDFVQEVAVTGKVTPAEKVDLSFEVGGRIGEVNVVVGQKVTKGDVLAKLSNGEYAASLQKSQAQYLSERARLRELERGARPEEISIATADVQVAAQNIAQAKLAVIEEMKDSYASADDAVKGKADQVFRYPRSSNPELVFQVEGSTTLKSSIELQRLKVTEAFVKWQSLIGSVNASNLSEAQISEARSYTELVQRLLNDLNTALTSTGGNLNQDPAYAQYRTDISAGRSSVNASLQALNSAVNTLRNNQSAFARAEEQLNIKKTGNTREEIDAQRANAQSAAAGVSSASASLNKTIIVAPFNGVVTRVAFKAGESVGSSDAIITVMSDSAFEIETNVSENDVPQLKAGQLAKVTLDALGDAVVFDAAVSAVDLSETIKDGVVTYKTRLQFLTRDERIKSGLTANVVIETDKRENVIKVPQTAIVIVKGKKNIKVAPANADTWNAVIDKQATLVPVSTGGIDREGDIEIVTGAQVGEKIVIKKSSVVSE